MLLDKSKEIAKEIRRITKNRNVEVCIIIQDNIGQIFRTRKSARSQAKADFAKMLGMKNVVVEQRDYHSYGVPSSCH